MQRKDMGQPAGRWLSAEQRDTAQQKSNVNLCDKVSQPDAMRNGSSTSLFWRLKFKIKVWAGWALSEGLTKNLSMTVPQLSGGPWCSLTWGCPSWTPASTITWLLPACMSAFKFPCFVKTPVVLDWGPFWSRVASS